MPKLKLDLNSRNHRIVWAMLCGFLLSLWTCAILWSLWERSSVLTSNARILEQLTNAVQEQTKALFQQANTSLLVASDWIANHPTEDPATSAEFIRLVEKLRNASDNLVDLRLVTREGELRYIPDHGQTHHTKVNDRDYFREQSGSHKGFYIANPVISRVTGKWGIPISVPIEKSGGNIAVLFAAIELDRIANAFDGQRLKPSGSIAVFRNDGTLLFRSPMSDTLEGISIAQSADWKNYLSVQPKGIFTSQQSPLDHVTRMVSHAQSGNYPLVLVVTKGMDDMLASWVLQTRILCVVTLLISAFAVGISYVLSRSMSSEIAARSELERLMLTDPLTGVGNRRLLDQRIDEEIVRAQRYKRSITAVFFDVDHFKAINDQYGHKFGDMVLKRIADSLSGSLRQSDFVGRYGGEEFVVLMVETAIDQAWTLVERMRQGIENLSMPELPQGVTVSAGLAQWRPEESAEALLQRSDQALYRAKAQGRNRSCIDLSVKN